LGTDAVLAALPASPVQLAHACLRLGFASAFPASWGDELVADACLQDLVHRGLEPAILCACPHVRDRLLRAGLDLAPWMISLVAPPVAVARYLRAAYGARTLHITYVGACPSGSDEAIDAQLTPEDLLALCRERGVSPASQPHLFESVIPPDRRRSLSMPGGAPSDGALREHAGDRRLVELTADDALAELADRLITRHPVLIDLAPRFGCTCSGVGDAVGGRDERRELIGLEPPRSREPVLDPAVQVDLEFPLPYDAPKSIARIGDPPGAAIASPHPRVPPLPSPQPSHAVIREFARGSTVRRALTMMRRHAAAETPAAVFHGGLVPRAYLAMRSRRHPARRYPAVLGAGPLSLRPDRERRFDRPLDIADVRRARRAPRAFVIPLAHEPPGPPPPPPATRKPGALLGLGAVIEFALSIAAIALIPR
jgi:Iron only hydrogenase large subunit, C-terminal domain